MRCPVLTLENGITTGDCQGYAGNDRALFLIREGAMIVASVQGKKGAIGTFVLLEPTAFLRACVRVCVSVSLCVCVCV